jgi:hypothetical protein
MGGVGERTGTGSRYAATFRVCESVRLCVGIVGTKRKKEMRGKADTVRVGVIRSSIDSYERTVLAHRGTIAANLCCTGLRV